MSKIASRAVTRVTNPAKDEQALNEAALQSLRAFRLARVANRRLPSQPEKEAA